MKLPSTLDERLRLAGWLILAGLVVELVTVFWVHALSFIVFISAGALLIGAGILLYLYSLVRDPGQP